VVKLRVTETSRARARAELRRYKVEPYVIAVDIYAASHHIGHGGWTWYTGTPGWMQRAGLESIFGSQCDGSSLHIDPCIQNSWPGFGIRLRCHSAQPHIKIENPKGVTHGVAAARKDGTLLTQRPLRFELADDRLPHETIHHVRLTSDLERSKRIGETICRQTFR
jgi:cyclic beta-1,2-glucan synthetase